MKISFIFTDQPNLAEVPSYKRYNSTFAVPDAAKLLPDIQAQVVAIGEMVGQSTNANLHISCFEIGLKNHPIKQNSILHEWGRGLFFSITAMCLYFSGKVQYPKSEFWYERKLSIYLPLSTLPVPRVGNYNFAFKWSTPEMIEEAKRLEILSQRLLTLLNTEGDWQFKYYHPWVKQKPLITKSKAVFKKINAERKLQEREEEKRKHREAKLGEKTPTNPQLLLTHGAGRTIGARPGIYKGIQMRSQLEIRFAAELDERNIKWIYEGEALGASSYLVDFYLPDLGVWIEVKGRFEARDRQVLPEVAKILKTDRQQRLLVYTSAGKCCVVNPSGFREIDRKNFWAELLR